MILRKQLGGEDYIGIMGKNDHPVGIYAEGDSLSEGQAKALKKMCRYLSSIKKSSKILLLGTGYGSSARYIAEHYKCQVDCINPNPEENKHLQAFIDELGLSKKVNILQDEVENIPFKRAYYDFVFSQDYLVFCEQMKTLFKSVHYVLKPEGRFVFSLPLKNPAVSGSPLEDINEGASQTIHPRTRDEILAIAKYADLSKVISGGKGPHLSKHFHLLKETYDIPQQSELGQSLDQWLDAADAGHLAWGLFLFQKTNA